MPISSGVTRHGPWAERRAPKSFMAVKPAIYSRASSALMSIPCFPITAASFSSYSGSASQRISISVPTRAGLGTGAQMRTALGWYTSVSSLGPRGGLSRLHQPDGCGPDSRKSSSVALIARKPARKKSSMPEGASALASRCGSGSPCWERYHAVEKFTSMIRSSFHTPTRLCRPTVVDTSNVQSFIGSIKGYREERRLAQTPPKSRPGERIQTHIGHRKVLHVLRDQRAAVRDCYHRNCGVLKGESLASLGVKGLQIAGALGDFLCYRQKKEAVHERPGRPLLVRTHPRLKLRNCDGARGKRLGGMPPGSDRRRLLVMSS